ncbi:ATP-binding protein [Streptomyces olivaceoviridis]
MGRTDELADLAHLLANGRLITLTGPPGSGKSRLAVQAAQAQARAGRATTVLVELDAVTGLPQLREHLTTHLAQTGTTNRSPLLLVLNDCDHLLDACGTVLSEAFARHPDLRVIATSREPLRIPGEVLYSIKGLPTPIPGSDDAPLADLVHFPAVRLFSDRARAVRPDFRLTAANARHVGTLCARLEGMPLAIELAAQLMRAFSVAAIHDQLDQAPLQLLTGGWRTAAPRHRSLRASIQWSYDRLPPDERRLFLALAEAPGGCEPDMAVALTATEVAPQAVPELLASLEAKSLLTALHDERSGSRFQMSETLRCFARDIVPDRTWQKNVRERSANWFITTVASVGTTGVLDRHHADRLARESDNLHHALAWLRTHDDPRHAPLVAAAETLDLLNGDSGTRPVTLSEVLSRTDAPVRQSHGVLSAQAVLLAWRRFDEPARRLAREVHAQAARAGDAPQQIRMETLLNLLTLPESERTAVRRLSRCLVKSRLQDDLPLVALSLHLLAEQVLVTGRTEHMAAAIDSALSVARELPLAGPLRSLLLARGALALHADDEAIAASLFTELLQTASDRPLWQACALEGFAMLAARSRGHDRALKLLAAARESRSGTTQTDTTGRWWRRQVSTVRTTVITSQSRKHIEAALAFGAALTAPQATAYALEKASAVVPGTSSDTGGLSRREWQVAALVAQGLTNRQIAERVFLSTRTIDTHVRNIRTALGLRSRAQIAAWVVQSTPRRSAG